MKSEPDVYSIEDLRRDGRAPWTGVRNFQARNFMRDAMRVGDRALFYHSSAEPAGVAGLARVCSTCRADPTQFDRRSAYFDPKATKAEPIWMLVDVSFEETFTRFVSLAKLRAEPRLAGLLVLKRGMRLSIQPVEPGHFDLICRMGRAPSRFG